MARTLRDLRQQDATRAFVKAGGIERRGKGSHVVVKMPNGVILSIPSGVLKVGLLQHLIKMAELTEEEFQRLL